MVIPSGSKGYLIVPVPKVRRRNTHCLVLMVEPFPRLPRRSICIKIESTYQERAIPMTDKPDPDKLEGPGGLTLRQIHEQVQKSLERDRKEQTTRNAVAPPKGRWQRWVRYVWGRSGRR
jgi:hypothetical protein